LPTFDLLEFHATYEEHQAQAGRSVVSRSETLEAWSGDRQIVRNKKGRRGKYLMLGCTEAGRAITVVLVETSHSATWMAYTAWDT
jgi:hypothetical protein